MTVGDLLSRISSREITEWQEYFAMVSEENSRSGSSGPPMPFVG